MNVIADNTVTVRASLAPSDVQRVCANVVAADGGVVRVVSDSMSPMVPAGALCRIEPCEARELKPGDVVLWRTANALVLHRFIGRRVLGVRRLLLSKADRHLRPDKPRTSSSAVGKLTALTVNGLTLPFLVSAWDRIAAASMGLFWEGVAPVLRGMRRSLGFARG